LYPKFCGVPSKTISEVGYSVDEKGCETLDQMTEVQFLAVVDFSFSHNA
jgi:hypothetical protein